jgi:hypothetical protein
MVLDLVAELRRSTQHNNRVQLRGTALNYPYNINLISTLLTIYLLIQVLQIYIISHISTPTLLIFYFIFSRFSLIIIILARTRRGNIHKNRGTQNSRNNHVSL